MEQPEIIEVDDTLHDESVSQLLKPYASTDIIKGNGERTYHTLNDGKYMLPNDDKEKNRLDLQHRVCKYVLDGKLQLAPIAQNFSGNVLDLGTGTGIWASEFATHFPSSKVLGIDLSPINPSFIPQNCSFRTEDYEEEWNHSTPFSFIHGRALISCLKDPSSTFAMAYQNLIPGGWLEIQDPIFPFKSQDGSLEQKGRSLIQWCEEVRAGSAKVGRPFADTSRYVEMMKDVGFVNVRQRILKVPLNGWPKDKKMKELGELSVLNLLDGLVAVKKIWTLALGYSDEDADEFMENVRSELKNPEIHAFCEFNVVFGQRPDEQS